MRRPKLGHKLTRARALGFSIGADEKCSDAVRATQMVNAKAAGSPERPFFPLMIESIRLSQVVIQASD